jgi:glycosyltransferase involved in cell wall biosynthesis
MIPTYNCAAYLPETLASVLAQDPGPEQMQIEVIDDCSSDNPQATVDELAPGRVAFHRQPQNVGHVRNFNTCIERSRGHLVHLLHGDDAVRPGFYATMQRPFLDHPEIGAACCRHLYVDEGGNWEAVSRVRRSDPGVLEDAAFRIVAGLAIQPPAMVVRREVYEDVGGFDTRISVAGEDIEMWTRIAAHYPIWYQPEPLALYHRRPSSLVSGSMRTGAAIRDTRLALKLGSEHLPRDRGAAAIAQGRQRIAGWALRQAAELATTGDGLGTAAQLREAVRTDRSATGILRFGATLWRVLAALARARRAGGPGDARA